MANKRKTFILTDGTISKINEIKDKLTYKHEVDVVVHAVNELYKSEFENYTAIAKARLNKPNASPEERAQRVAEQEALIKKARADKPQEQGRKICQTLGGEERENYCYWTSYEFQYNGVETTREERQPLMYLSSSDIENQYEVGADKVTKEEYLKRKKEINATLLTSKKNTRTKS